MSRRKRASANLEKADLRLQSIKSIGATLDLGNGFSVVAFQTEIDNIQNTLDEYNQLLASIDEKSAALRDLEKHIADYSASMLVAIAAKYGKNSTEYAQAGGIRKSDIKRSARKTTKNARGPSPAL